MVASFLSYPHRKEERSFLKKNQDGLPLWCLSQVRMLDLLVCLLGYLWRCAKNFKWVLEASAKRGVELPTPWIGPDEGELVPIVVPFPLDLLFCFDRAAF